MSAPAPHCDFCGARIGPTDYEKGRAVVLFRKTYCNRCMQEAVRRNRAKISGPPPAPLPGPERPATASPGPAAPAPARPVTARQGIPGTVTGSSVPAVPVPEVPVKAGTVTASSVAAASVAPRPDSPDPRASAEATPRPVQRPAPPPPTRRVAVGEHACGLYGSEEERRAQVCPFIAEGLQAGAKVIHFMNAPTPARVLGDFRVVGLLVQPYLASGQLEVHPASKILGVPADFDPPAMALRLAVALDHALRAGFTGLRVASDMTWALSSLIEQERVIDFESRLSSIATGGKGAFLCQYSVYRFEVSSLQTIRSQHPLILAKGTAESLLKDLALSS